MSDKEFEKGLIVELPDDYEIPYSIIENFILDIGGLSPEKKGTLIMLRRSIGNVKNKETGKLEAKKDGAWPSLNNLAYRVGVSKPTIIKSIDGEPVNPITIDTVIKNLPMKDSNKIIRQANKLNGKVGVDINILGNCPDCKNDVLTTFRYTSEFFRPTDDE